MPRKAVSGIMLTMLLIGVLMLTFNAQQVKAESISIMVPRNYPTIQEAINNANEGDIIFVSPGTYYENVTLDRSISLIGMSGHNTIIDGGGTAFGAVVYVTADDINVSNFTVQNSRKDGVGIWLNRCRNCTVSGNNVKDCGVFGGIGGTGIELDYCKGCTVDRNNASNNNGGIMLAFSQNCTVYGNSVNRNYKGIDTVYCSDCIFIGNTLSNNEDLGIHMFAPCYCLFRDNNITGSNQNFGVHGDKLSHFVNDVDISNMINGKPIVYLLNRHGLTVAPLTYPTIGYLAIVNSTNIIIENLTLGHNGEGVLFAYVNNSIIRKVGTSNNEYGIYMVNCDNCTVNENIATNNFYGIRLDCSYNCTVTGNTATNNNVGIRLSNCLNCTVSGNIERLFWMEWWFWATVIAGTGVLAVGVYFLKKRKSPNL